MPRLSPLSRAKTGTIVGMTLAVVALAGGAAAEAGPPTPLDILGRQAERMSRRFMAWYRITPPSERVTWGGLAASALLALGVTFERTWRVRRGRVLPSGFVKRFRSRLADGRIDRGKGLDFCELNPSPAARVALAALQRWGRPTADLDRAVTLARGREVDRLRRNIGTLRRIAALAPLLGLLGTLTAASRALATLGPGAAWGPALAAALAPLTVGVALAILALVAYDGLMGRVETLAGELDRLGAETIDAIALAAPEPLRPAARADGVALPRGPHSIRVEVPESARTSRNEDD